MFSLKRLAAWPTALVLSISPLAASANVDIVFDYSFDTAGFFSGANLGRRTVLDAAAAVFETRLTDTLAPITSSGTFNFTAQFFNPSSPNVTESIPNFSIALNEIRVYVGGADLTGSTLGIGGPGGFNIAGNPAQFGQVSRGQAGYTPIDGNPANDTDFGPWGGALAFDTTGTSWYFNAVTPPSGPADGNDFFSVAVHELAHLLGFGTVASWDNKVNGIAGTFTGTNSGTRALSPDLGHWAEGTMSSIDGSGSFETLMDPSIVTGTRKLLTDLDQDGLMDVGWVFAVPVPEPASSALLLAGLAAVGWTAQRRRARPGL